MSPSAALDHVWLKQTDEFTPARVARHSAILQRPVKRYAGSRRERWFSSI